MLPRGLLALSAVLLLAGTPARAEEAVNQQQLDTVQQQLQSSQAAQDRLAADIEAAAKARDEISARLVEISQKIQANEAAIAASQDDLDNLSKQKVLQEANLGEKQEVLSQLLAGLQRLDQDPPPALVVEPGDVLSALRGAMVFGAVVPDLRDEARKLSADLARLDQLTATIATRRKDLQAEIAALAADRADLGSLIEQKKELVDSGSAELEAEKKRAAALAAKATTLKQLMAELDKARAEAEAQRAKQAAAEEEARKKRQAALETPRLAFAEARGKLTYPAQGQILKRFGDDDGLGGTIQGTVIATSAKAQVTAPADGKIEFAGPFRSYGQVVILNPGGGYHILLAGMGNITTQTGEFLRAGEPVGQMSDGPSSVTLLGDVIRDKRPVLYIEFRNNTDAVDSTPWWIGSSKEARG